MGTGYTPPPPGSDDTSGLPMQLVGCLILLAIPVVVVTCGFVALVAYDVASDGALSGEPRPPEFIREVEPTGVERVLAHRCCAFLSEAWEHYQVFYGSQLPFEEIRDSYAVQMQRQGFHAVERDLPPYGHVTSFEKDGWCHTFHIKPFAGLGATRMMMPTDAEKLVGIERYPHAYVATYLHFCP